MSNDPHAEEIDCSRALNVYYFTINIEIWFSFVPREIPLSGNPCGAIRATRMVHTE
jgi:hypothetical protein